MSSGILLDTHVWLWLQNDELKSNTSLLETISDALAVDALFVCSISMLEIANGAKRGRIDLLGVSPDTWFNLALRSPGVRVLEITPEVALQTMKLPPAFHGDPGDRLIASTAIVEDLTLLTHDKTLLRFGKNGLMRVLKVDKDK